MMSPIDTLLAKNALKRLAEDQLSHSETDAVPEEQPEQPSLFARLAKMVAAKKPQPQFSPQPKHESA